MADRSGTVTADGDRRVHARELARAAWGLCLLLRPAYTLRLLGDARPAWTDAVHAASALVLAAFDLRRRRLTLLDATVAGT